MGEDEAEAVVEAVASEEVEVTGEAEELPIEAVALPTAALP